MTDRRDVSRRRPVPFGRRAKLAFGAVAATLAVAALLQPRANETAGAAPVGCVQGLALMQAPPGENGQPAYTACIPRLARRTTRSRIDQRYSAAVSRVVGGDVTVVCWSVADWALVDDGASTAFGESTSITGGFVWEEQSVANLPPGLCRILDEIVYGTRRSVDRWSAWAFKNLTHEALHVAGIDNEAEAECFALQRMGHTIRELALSNRYAETLVAVSWSRYPRLRSLEPTYFTEECRNDGRLDLDRASTNWPTAHLS